MQYVFSLCLASFIQHDVSEIHSCHCAFQWFIPSTAELHGWTPTSCWISGFFQFGNIMNKTSRNIHMHVFFVTIFFIAQPKCAMAWSYGMCMFNLKETFKLFSNMAAPLYISSNQVFTRVPVTPHPSQHSTLSPFKLSHSSECAVASHCSFSFHSPED